MNAVQKQKSYKTEKKFLIVWGCCLICSPMKSQKKVNILWMNDFLIFCTTFSSEHKSNTDTRPSNITFWEIFSLVFVFQIFVFCIREKWEISITAKHPSSSFSCCQKLLTFIQLSQFHLGRLSSVSRQIPRKEFSYFREKVWSVKIADEVERMFFDSLSRYELFHFKMTQPKHKYFKQKFVVQKMEQQGLQEFYAC